MPEQPVSSEQSTALALLGHDLRAALAEVQTGLALIQKQEVPPALGLAFQRCIAAGDTLSQLIDQSILVCLGQAAPGPAPIASLDTRAFVEGFRRRMAGRAADSGHGFTLNLVGPVPDRLGLDRTAVDRVLTNLVGNALVHTPPCAITVTLRFTTDDLLLIAVTDEGPGFPPPFLEHLARDFTLPDDARRPGGGLGLQSVKHLVAAMGGRVNARNTERGGAEIGICLPVSPLSAQAGAAANAPPVALPDLTGLTLLMTDDSATNRELVGILAQSIGARITTQPDGFLTQTALQSACPDLLILDAEMPGLGGVELLRWLRQQPPPLGLLPVLALTSHLDPTVRQDLSAAGAQAVLTKPVLCPRELGYAVLATLGRAAPPAFDLAPLQRLRALAGEEAAAELFARLDEDLASARLGLRRAAALGDLGQLCAHSHVVIALAGTAGAMGLHADAQALNELAHAGAPSDHLATLTLALDHGLEQLAQAVRCQIRPPHEI